MDWLKANLKEVLMVAGALGVPLGFVADTVYENGHTKGLMDGKKEVREKLQPKIDTLNAKYNHAAGAAAVKQLMLDDC